ncbi:hypothetical protein BU17DRAFT_61768 [Hysterangium stoloniferum]|nr:hypothetical protein BU17DRAFT_61768 [Hysterangium stoloniferum]
MSYSAAQIASFVQAESDSQLVNYWIIAGSVIALYDTILTFPQEVQFIWMGKLWGVALLYVAARFSMLIYQAVFPIFALTPLGAKAKRVFRTVEGFFLKLDNHVIFIWRNFFDTCLCHHAFTAVSVIMLGDLISLSLCFERGIFGATVYRVWTLVKLRRSLPEMTSGPSLASLILKQGVLRFFIIISWTLQIVMTDHPGIGGLTGNIENPYLYFITRLSHRFTLVSSVSVILFLRFFLDLCQLNAHPNGTSQTKHLEPCPSFKAAARRILNTIIEDLGDPEDEALFASQARSVSGQVLRPSAGNDSSPAVNLQEFPWAGVAGILDNVEAETGNNPG